MLFKLVSSAGTGFSYVGMWLNSDKKCPYIYSNKVLRDLYDCPNLFFDCKLFAMI